ncbi:MAG: type II toxin-antitoxin system death-on-curing family toxin [Pseudomonadota bacterium]
MKATLYPTLDEVIKLHEQLIALDGGSLGLRDPGLLASALGRPQTGYYNSLSEQAAALLQSLVSNHGFVDGNKRIAIVTTLIFLEMNGVRVDFDPDEAEDFIIERVIKNKAILSDITTWLEQHFL